MQYQNVHNGQFVVENLSKGAGYSKTLVTVGKSGGENRVVDATGSFVEPLVSGVTPDPAVVATMAPLRVQLAVAFDAKIATVTDVFVRANDVEGAERRRSAISWPTR